MFVATLVLRNLMRHKLRTLLTALGIVVAIAAFGILRTIVDEKLPIAPNCAAFPP